MLVSVPSFVFCKETVAVFPLYNTTGNPFLEWIGFIVPEMLHRSAGERADVFILDPAMHSSGDSAVQDRVNDRYLAEHRKRWHWDMALTGSYAFSGDTVNAVLECFRAADTPVLHHRKEVRGSPADMAALCKGFLDTAASLLPRKLHIGGMQVPRRGAAYAAYCQGYRHECRGDVKRALATYRHVLAMDASFVPALHRIGMLYTTCGSGAQGLPYCERAFALAPQQPAAAAAVALALLKDRESMEPLPFMEKNRALLERSDAGIRALGIYYGKQGDYTRAIATLSRPVVDGSPDPEIRFALAQAYLAAGRSAEATNLFQGLLRLKPHSIPYSVYLSMAYRKEGAVPEAIGVLDNALGLDTAHPMLLINLAGAYMDLSWFDRAERYLATARRLYPGRCDVALDLGILYWRMGREEDARALFKECLDRRADIPAALNNLATAGMLSGDLKAAVRLYEEAASLAPANERILFNLGTALTAMKRYKQALAVFESALRIGGQRPDILTAASRCAEYANDFDKAAQYDKMIVAATGNNSAALEHQVAMLSRKERHQDAVRALEEHRAHYQLENRLRMVLAGLYRKTMAFDAAIDEYAALKSENEGSKDPQVYLELAKTMYERIERGQADNFEETIYALKIAKQYAPEDPAPDILIGTIYMDFKRYPDLAADYWNQALLKARDEKEKSYIEQLLSRTKK